MTPLQRMLAEPQIALVAMARRTLPRPALLQELAASNPNCLTLIQENQADFMTLLNGTDPLPTPAAAAAAAAAASPAPPQAGGGGANAPPPGGAVQIQVTAEEAAAIERLEAMTGFPRDAVLQAFLACDKDENLAANFLFDS